MMPGTSEGELAPMQVSSELMAHLRLQNARINELEKRLKALEQRLDRREDYEAEQREQC